MSQFLNRKKVRTSLIHYYKTISKCQKKIQAIQQQLILHPRFNPVVLYKKIAAGDRMKLKDLKEYWRKKVGVKREEGMKMYVVKYNMKRKELNEQITVQMYFFTKFKRFLETLIPYTPNCLRQVNETILRQLQTQHMDITVQSLYHKLISISTQSLYLIRLLQRQIGLSSWQKVQAFMVQDIVQNGKRIDLTIKETTDVIYVRKWMELWVDVDEYEVLNLMRFFGGDDQSKIGKIFDNDVKVQMKCTCRSHNDDKKTHSKGHTTTLNEDYFSSGQSRKSKSRPKIRFYTETQGQQKNHKQISQDNPNYSSQVQQISTFQPYQKNSSTDNKTTSLTTFLSYITTLVQSQKSISFNRVILHPYRKQVEQILHDILSKKKNCTKCEKILMYIEKFLDIKKEKFEKLVIQMGNAKIDNSVVFKLFGSQMVEKRSGDRGERKKQLTHNQIMQEISNVLHKFIRTRSKLIKLSVELIKYPIEQIIAGVLMTTSKQRKKSLKIKIEDMRLFLLKYTEKSIGKKYLLLLMRHLGDGNEITTKSLAKVLNKQAEYMKESWLQT